MSTFSQALHMFGLPADCCLPMSRMTRPAAPPNGEAQSWHRGSVGSRLKNRRPFACIAL